MSAVPWRKHFWRNTATNYLGVVTRIGSGLVLFRLLFQHLSQEQFGYYSLLWSLFGYAILLDFGLGVAVQKAVAQKTATGDEEGLNRLVATVVWSFAAMGVGLFLVAWTARPWFLDWIKIHPADRAEFGTAFLVFMGALAVNFPLALFPEILRGVQRLDLVNWAIIGSLLANLAVMTWGLLAHWSFPVIVLLSVATTICHEIVTLVIARRVLPRLSLHPRHFHLASVRGVMGFSFVAYLITCTNLLILKTDQTVISVTLGVAMVALYQLGYKASEIFSNFTKQLHESLSPAAAHLGASQDEEGLRDLFLQTSRLTFLVATPLYALAAVYLGQLIGLLSGKPVDGQTYRAGEMLLLAAYSTLLANSCSKRILVMCGWEKPLLKLSLLEAGLNLGLSVVLVHKMGIAGVALGTLIPAVSVGWFGLIPMAARFVRLSVVELGREMFAPMFLPVAASLLVLGLLYARCPIPPGTHAFGTAWRGVLVLLPIIGLGWPIIRKQRARPTPTGIPAVPLAAITAVAASHR